MVPVCPPSLLSRPTLLLLAYRMGQPPYPPQTMPPHHSHQRVVNLQVLRVQRPPAYASWKSERSLHARCVDNDDWYATTNRSGVKPPRMKVPTFNGDPRNWPMFIQMFKVFIHDTSGSDAERMAHLHEALTPDIRKTLGSALLNPGLYQHALSELLKRYGNPQIVAQACSSSLLKLNSFKDGDFQALKTFSAELHSVVATLRLGGYGMELHSNHTLSQLVSKLPPALKSRWGEKSWAMNHLTISRRSRPMVRRCVNGRTISTQ